MSKSAGAAFLVTILTMGVIWYHARKGVTVDENSVTINAGDVVPSVNNSSLPSREDSGWTTPFYLRINFPFVRDIGSPVMPSIVNKGLRGIFAPPEVPPQW